MSKISAIYFSNNEEHGLDVGYGISALQKCDYNLSIHKINKDNINQEIENISYENPRIVIMFSAYNYYDLISSVSSQLKLQLNNVHIVICHSIASCLAEKLLKDMRDIDIVVIGEYEKTLAELSFYILNDLDYRHCKGIAFLENETFIKNDNQEFLDVNKIYYPEREHFQPDIRFFHIYGSRGCEGKCSFCYRNILYKTSGHEILRFREIKNIVTEIDCLVKKYNCKLISFSDSTFCSKDNITDRLEELYCNLKQKSYWIQFSINLRAEQITTDTLPVIKKLRTVGLSNIFIGIESFNDNDLRLFKKISNSETNIKAINRLKNINANENDYKIKVDYGFINFNPYTTIMDLKNNLYSLRKYCIDINPYILSSKVSLNYLTPLTKIVDNDNLFMKKVKDFTVKELMERSFEYKFVDPKVQEVYTIFNICDKRLKLKNANGIEFLRNRYCHFYNYDMTIIKFDEIYQKWINAIDDFSYKLFEYILLSDARYDNKLSTALSMCDKFHNEFDTIHSQLKKIQQRIMIQLKKIDELNYYRNSL